MSIRRALRRIIPNKYDTAQILFRAYPVQHLLRYPRRLSLMREQRRNNGVFAIDLHSTAGFFGTLQTYLYILQYCKANDLIPRVRFVGGPYYSPEHDENWFKNYFVSKIQLPEWAREDARGEKLHVSRISMAAELFARRYYDEKLTFQLAHRLISESLDIGEGIVGIVDSFVRQEFEEGETLGIHYRGSDKVSEAHPVTYQDVETRTRHFLARHPDIATIFVTTDEREFAEFMESRSWDQRLVRVDCKHYSVDRSPVHFTTAGDAYSKGEEALVSCLLLSRCQYCLKSASYLSAWAKIFNPDLSVVLLNQPKWHANWFPDRELWKEQQATDVR